MKTFKTEGFVIKRRNFGESDRIITIFSNKYGKIQFKAGGVRKITSRRSSHIELLNLSNFSFYKGRKMPVLTEVESINTYANVKKDLKKVGFAYHVCEIIDGLCAENQEHEDIFHLIRDFLIKLDSEDEIEGIVKDFELNLLFLLGFFKKEENKNINTKQIIEEIMEKKLKSRQILPHFV